MKNLQPASCMTFACNSSFCEATFKSQSGLSLHRKKCSGYKIHKALAKREWQKLNWESGWLLWMQSDGSWGKNHVMWVSPIISYLAPMPFLPEYTIFLIFYAPLPTSLVICVNTHIIHHLIPMPLLRSKTCQTILLPHHQLKAPLQLTHWKHHHLHSSLFRAWLYTCLWNG